MHPVLAEVEKNIKNAVGNSLKGKKLRFIPFTRHGINDYIYYNVPAQVFLGIN